MDILNWSGLNTDPCSTSSTIPNHRLYALWMNISPLIEDFQITSGKSFLLSNLHVFYIFCCTELKTFDKSFHIAPIILNCLKPHIICQEGATKPCCVLCLEENIQKRFDKISSKWSFSCVIKILLWAMDMVVNVQMGLQLNFSRLLSSLKIKEK